MNDEFIANVLSHGETGKQWLSNLPKLIQQAEDKWSIKVASPFKLNYNYVAPVIRSDGSKAVLKIGFPGDVEFQREIEALRLFNGEGISKLLEADQKKDSILLEQVLPGEPLSTVEDDEDATRILALVMKKLWKPLPENHTFADVSEWRKAIPE